MVMRTCDSILTLDADSALTAMRLNAQTCLAWYMRTTNFTKFLYEPCPDHWYSCRE